MTFSHSLSAILERQYKGNIAALARACGMNDNTIRGIVSGERVPRIDTAEKIAKALQMSLDAMAAGGTEDARSDIALVKRLDIEVSAGMGASTADWLPEREPLAFSRSWLNSKGYDEKNLSVVGVRGDSMEPHLMHGDILLVHSSTESPVDGCIYVVVHDDALFVKSWQWRGGKRANLVSYNTTYDPVPIDLSTDEDTFRVVGRVIWCGHYWG